MKKLAIAVTTIALIGTPAFAADVLVKTPPPPPAPVNSWTDWYVGANFGYGWGNVTTDFNSVAVQTMAEAFVATGTFSSTAGINTLAGFNGQQHPDGFLGGVQIGYNLQLSPILGRGA